jgi:hypothetical protein
VPATPGRPKPKAAEAAGDLKQALALAQDGDVRACSAEGDALATRLALRLGQAAEKERPAQ